MDTPSMATADKYPWARLKVGEGFWVYGKKITSMSSAKVNAARKYHHVYRCRSDKGSVYIQRIK